MRFSYQSLRAALGRTDTKAGSHKTFNIIQSLLSHAHLDNVTFKTTRECRCRKHISGNLFFFFFFRIIKSRGKKLVGKNWFGWHFLTVTLSSEEVYRAAYSHFQVGSNKVIILFFVRLQDFELIGYHLKREKNANVVFILNLYWENHTSFRRD